MIVFFLLSDGEMYSSGDYRTFEFVGPNEMAEAVITVNLGGKDVTARISTSDGRLFLIRNMGGEKHVWIEVGEEREPARAVDVMDAGNRDMFFDEEDLPMEENRQNGLTTITVKVYYADQYAASTNNLMGDVRFYLL